MFHIEIRQFPHNVCRFNLEAEELRPIVEPWVRDRPVEFGERRWSPFEARLTILEGPELALQQLSMGRGWGAAQRAGVDVTERMLAGARAAAEQAAPPAPGGTSASAAPAGQADPLALAVQLAALLGPDAGGLLEAWRALAAGSPELTPSQALALAEQSLAAAAANGD